jgi:hypothetical protein
MACIYGKRIVTGTLLTFWKIWYITTIRYYMVKIIHLHPSIFICTNAHKAAILNCTFDREAESTPHSDYSALAIHKVRKRGAPGRMFPKTPGVVHTLCGERLL